MTSSVGLELRTDITLSNVGKLPRRWRCGIYSILGTMLGGSTYVICMGLLGACLLLFSAEGESLWQVFQLLFIYSVFGALLGGFLSAFFALPCLLSITIVNRLCGRPLQPWFLASLVGGMTGVVAIGLMADLQFGATLLTDPTELGAVLLALACGQVVAGATVGKLEWDTLDWKTRVMGHPVPTTHLESLRELRQASPSWATFFKRQVSFSFDIRSLMALTTVVACLSALAHYTGVGPSQVLLPLAIWAVGQVVMVPLLWCLIQLRLSWLASRRTDAE